MLIIINPCIHHPYAGIFNSSQILSRVDFIRCSHNVTSIPENKMKNRFNATKNFFYFHVFKMGGKTILFQLKYPYQINLSI